MQFVHINKYFTAHYHVKMHFDIMLCKLILGVRHMLTNMYVNNFQR